MKSKQTISESQAQSIHVMAGTVFQPRTPIHNRDFFAGRWEQLTTITDAVSQVGLHVVIYGERGVGKTSIANIIAPLLRALRPEAPGLLVKVNANSEDTFSRLWLRAFDEVTWETVQETIGFAPQQSTASTSLRQALALPETLSIDDVRRVMSRLPGSVFVFDEFDRMDSRYHSSFTDLIKGLSDSAVDTTVILVGVAETIDELIGDHASIERAIVQVPMPRMRPDELREILKKAQTILEIDFEERAANRIVRTSQGLPHYTHVVGLHAVRCACRELTAAVSCDHVGQAFLKTVKDAQQSVRTRYSNATHSAHPDALYRQVLLACAIAACRVRDEQGYFQAAEVVAPLTSILGKPVAISMFNRHLVEFCQEKRHFILEQRGKERSYRYRFRDPLMTPYVIMQGLASGMVTDDEFERLLGSQE